MAEAVCIQGAPHACMIRDPSHRRDFRHNSNSMQIWCSSYPNFKIVVSAFFCTRHVACANIGSSLLDWKWNKFPKNPILCWFNSWCKEKPLSDGHLPPLRQKLSERSMQTLVISQICKIRSLEICQTTPVHCHRTACQISNWCKNPQSFEILVLMIVAFLMLWNKAHGIAWLQYLTKTKRF